VGVEHAPPAALRACILEGARPSFPPGRSEFTQRQLEEDGLVGDFKGSHGKVGLRANVA
jgi:hypothetical protein